MTESSRKKRPIVYIVSDSIGETGEFVVKAAATQFHPTEFDIRRAPFVEDKFAIDLIIESASKYAAFIVFTLVIPELRNYLIEQAQAGGIAHIDILTPVMKQMEVLTGEPAQQKPGMVHLLDHDYFKKIEAIEFAVKYDDGRDPQGVLDADIVLVGVSRTSKTPLSMYLAHKKYKVANVPLVPEIKPPKELFMIDKHKIVGLKINLEKLNDIRKERLIALGLTSDASYAQEERILEELAYAESIMNQIDCKQIDVSNKAVEETASLIQQLFED